MESRSWERFGNQFPQDVVFWVRFKSSGIVRVPREAAFAWWSDYSEGDHDSSEFVGRVAAKRRNIRREGDTVTFEDVGSARFLGREIDASCQSKVTLHPPERIDDETRFAHAINIYTYDFEPVAEGTRITMEGDWRWQGWFRILTLFTKGWLKRQMQWDLDTHCKDLESEYRPT